MYWEENLGQVRESWTGERELDLAESLALVRQPKTWLGVLDWKGSRIGQRDLNQAESLTLDRLGRKHWIGEGSWTGD